MKWHIKQRLVSRSEPELGLGIVTACDFNDDRLEVFFPVIEQKRQYSLKNAPVMRFRLPEGATLYDQSGHQHVIVSVEEDKNGLLHYHCKEISLWEWEIADAGVHRQQNVIDELLSRHWSHHRTYDLRQQAWHLRGLSQAQQVRGLVGPRVTPLAHQLYIASEVSRRRAPRAVLADEVGLGKTIEAGLIFSSLKALGRAERVMILAPQALVNQWVAEMFRRFGEVFSILDETRCQEESASLEMSAFQANQKVIVAIDFFLENLDRLTEATQAGWDLIIIDEAHHLDWDEEDPNPKWAIAKTLSAHTNGLLLLTATPRQHGLCTQFGLLNLVDPKRFSDYESFLAESEEMINTARMARSLVSGVLTEQEKNALKMKFSDDEQALRILNKKEISDTDKNCLLQWLVDRHGSGRVLFRNRRERLKGFPTRHLISVELTPSSAYVHALQTLNASTLSGVEVMDFATARGYRKNFDDNPQNNPRFRWLAHFLKEKQNEKILVICASRERVLQTADYLAAQGIDVGVFHDGLKVIDRDRQAALFSEPRGVSALISSEIGGEGRNFQFAKTMVLFDLPHHPDLLEQRIGRLDRIGQGDHIYIVVPWMPGTPEEVLFKWYHEGLAGFEESWNGADPFLDEFGQLFLDVCRSFFKTDANYINRKALLSELIEKTKERALLLKQERAESIDILIDLNSFDEKKGKSLLNAVEDRDDDPSLEFFLHSVFDHYGVDYEELDDRGSLVIKADELMFIDKFPGITPNEDTSIAFDRKVALAREDFQFMSCDHLIAQGAIGLLLDRNEGVASMCRWPNSPLGPGVLIEVSSVLSAEGRADLELSHYLPIAQFEVQFTHTQKVVNETRHKDDPHALVELSDEEIPEDLEGMRDIIDSLVERALSQSMEWANAKIAQALEQVEHDLSEEMARLEYLAKVNPNVSDEDLRYQKEKGAEIIRGLKATKPRLDSIRVIFT